MSTFLPDQIDPTLAVAAQLWPEDMPALVAGFRSVMNSRPDFEGGAGQPTRAQLEEAAWNAGLEYRYLPVPPAGHTAEQASSMVRAVPALPPPVLASCRSGRRSAALYRLGRGVA